MALVKPVYTSTVDGLPQPVNTAADSVAANGFYPQNGAVPDTAAGVSKNISNGLVLTDAAAGSHTLTQLALTPSVQTLTCIPSATFNITSAAQQLPSSRTLLFLSNTTGGGITLTSTPTIDPAGVAVGQLLILHALWTSTNVIRVTRSVATAIALDGSFANRELPAGATLTLVWDGTAWVELAYTRPNLPP